MARLTHKAFIDIVIPMTSIGRDVFLEELIESVIELPRIELLRDGQYSVAFVSSGVDGDVLRVKLSANVVAAADDAPFEVVLDVQAQCHAPEFASEILKEAKVERAEWWQLSGGR